MNDEIRQFIAQMTFDRASVEQLATMIPSDDVELDGCIAEAVEKVDQNAFVYLVIAALSRERRVDARHLAGGTMLLPDGMIDVVASRMSGDVPEYLMEGLRHAALTPINRAQVLHTIVSWCEKHRDGGLPEAAVTEARSLARLKPEFITMTLLLALDSRIKDAGFHALIRQYFVKVPENEWKSFQQEAVVAATVGESQVMDVVPEEGEADTELEGGGTTMRRAVPRIGRNEPCHCGSGRKYKHCCYEKDQKRLRHSSDVPGMTREELRARPEPHLTTARITLAQPHEIARYDPTLIPPARLVDYFLRLSAFNMLDRAVEAFDVVGYSQNLEGAWTSLLIGAVRARRSDIGHRLVKLREGTGWTEDKLDLSERLLLAQDDPAKCIRLIEGETRKALRTEGIEELLDLAAAVTLSEFPGLGILLYRSVIAIAPSQKAAAALWILLQTRDRLNLSADDPISDLVDARLARQQDSGIDAAALRDAQEKLEAKRRETRELRESLDRLQNEIASREKSPLPKPSAFTLAADQPAIRELRERVEDLKAALKERHSERNALRRDLEKARTDLETFRQDSSVTKDSAGANRDISNEADLLLPQDESANQPVRIIEFPRGFQDRLEGFPRHVARATMSMLGRIAAGEPAAFVGALRLKASPAVMRQRIGIDHRLLFRLLPDRVQVVDLISRQDLERRIKSLRGLSPTES